MKVHRTIMLLTASESAAAFASALRKACRQMPRWKFLARRSKDYADAAGRPSFLIAFHGDARLPAAAVALTLRGGEKRLHFDSPNIVPRTSGQLSLDEYNQIAARFVADLKQTTAYKNSGVRAFVSSGTIGLAEIISAKECRKFFMEYLNGFPLTYHGTDIRNLDRFICALYRFNAKVSPDDLGHYLAEDLGWDPVDAAWVRNRVRAGLELLAVDRRF